MKRQPLVGGQGIDMPNTMHLPQIDFAMIAVRITQMPGFEWNRPAVPLANSNQFVDFGWLQGRLRRETAQRVALPTWTIDRPCKDVG